MSECVTLTAQDGRAISVTVSRIHFCPDQSPSRNADFRLSLHAWLLLAVASLVHLPLVSGESSVLVRSLADSADRPSVVVANAQPIRWKLTGQTDEPEPGGDALEAETKAVGQPEVIHLAVYSVSDQRLLANLDLSLQSGEVLQDEPMTQPVFEGELELRLEPGVYEIRLEPSSTSRKWSQLLPWDTTSDYVTADPISTKAWPLIVLPAPQSSDRNTSNRNDAANLNADFNTGQKRASDLPRLLVHWNRPAKLGDKTASTVPSESDRSSAASPLAWIRGDSTFSVSLSTQVWADRLATIDQRLSRIRRLTPTGILLPPMAPESESITNSNNSQADVELRYLTARCRELGLPVWHLKTDTSDSNLAREVVDPASEYFSVADFRRGASSMLRSRFPPSMHEASEQEFVWFGTRYPTSDASDSLGTTATHLAAPPMAPSPLSRVDDRFAMKSWLTDWSHWAIHLSNGLTAAPRSTDGFDQGSGLLESSPEASSNEAAMAAAAVPHGLIIDEALIQGVSSGRSLADGVGRQETASVEESIVLWTRCWRGDSRWLEPVTHETSMNSTQTTGNENVASTPKNTHGLVHVRQCIRSGRTVLICFNQAPWPMRLDIPLDDLVQWNATFESPFAGSQDQTTELKLTLPRVSPLGSTLVIPPMGTVVCQTNQELSRKLKFGQRIEAATDRIPELTRSVTTIVEHLGLLGELASLSAPASHLVSNLHDRNRESRQGVSQRANSRSWMRVVSDKQSTEDAQAKSSTWGAAIWSPDRWGFGHAVSSDNKSRPTTATEQLGNPSSDRSAASPIANDNAMDDSSSCRNLLTNGGFEESSAMGIPGWMHSQHPSDAVRIDQREKQSGNHSIRLDGKDARGSTAWLISRDLYPPETGRLGVSLALRGEPVDQVQGKTESKSSPARPNDQSAETLAIRIAIEGERDGQPIRQAKTIEIPANGQWQPARVVLQWLDLDPLRDTKLRLTIDNLSPSPIWIDDVVVTDYFASQAERTELQSLAYLAVTGLQHSDLLATARLLNNFWAGELLRVAQQTPVSLLPDGPAFSNRRPTAGEPSTATKRSRFPFDSPSLPRSIWNDSDDRIVPPAETPSLPQASTPIRSEPKPAKRDESPSISRRIRGWLPSPLRF